MGSNEACGIRFGESLLPAHVLEARQIHTLGVCILLFMKYIRSSMAFGSLSHARERYVVRHGARLQWATTSPARHQSSDEDEGVNSLGLCRCFGSHVELRATFSLLILPQHPPCVFDESFQHGLHSMANNTTAQQLSARLPLYHLRRYKHACAGTM